MSAEISARCDYCGRAAERLPLELTVRATDEQGQYQLDYCSAACLVDAFTHTPPALSATSS